VTPTKSADADGAIVRQMEQQVANVIAHFQSFMSGSFHRSSTCRQQN